MDSLFGDALLGSLLEDALMGSMLPLPPPDAQGNPPSDDPSTSLSEGDALGIPPSDDPSAVMALLNLTGFRLLGPYGAWDCWALFLLIAGRTVSGGIA